MSFQFQPARFLPSGRALAAAVFHWRRPALVLGGLLVGGLAACTVMVKANNAPQTAPAYYLRGRNLTALHVEAARLCPAGYVATREWQGYEGPDHGGLFKSLFAQAVDWFAPPAFDEAQMDVQCRVATATKPSAATPAEPPAPSASAPPSTGSPS